MPRKGDYMHWQSNHCLVLRERPENELNGNIDWVDPERPVNMDDIEEFDGKLWEKHTGDGNPRGIIAGRAHREEAILIQLRGTLHKDGQCANKCAHGDGIFKSCRVSPVHRGACGNCVWQSKGMDCIHALPELEKEASDKKRLADAKQSLLDNKHAIKSSKRTTKTLAREKAARGEPADEPGPAPAPVAKVRKTGKAAGKAGKTASAVDKAPPAPVTPTKAPAAKKRGGGKK